MTTAVAHQRTKSPRWELGDSGCECRPACVADPGSPNGPVSPGFHPGLFDSYLFLVFSLLEV